MEAYYGRWEWDEKLWRKVDQNELCGGLVMTDDDNKENNDSDEYGNGNDK